MKSNNTPKLEAGNFDFVGKVGLFGGISALLVVFSLVFLAVRGISYGIDFAVGTEMQVRFAQPVEIGALRAEVEKLNLPDPQIQTFENSEYVIRFQTVQGKTDKETNEIQNQSVTALRDTINNGQNGRQKDFGLRLG